MRITLVLPVLLTVLGLLLGTSASLDAKEPGLNARVQTFKKSLRSKDPKAKARAFEILRGAKDPSIIDHLTWGIREVRKEESKIHAAQKKTEAEFEKLFTKLNQANQTFEASNRSSKDMERFNKASKKISKGLDGASKQLKNLENDFTRNRAMLAQAVLVAAELLEELDGEAFAEALARITEQWLHAKAIEDRYNWFDAVYSVDKPAVAQALHGVAKNAEVETTLRVRAIDALASRRDGEMFGESMKLLKLPTEQQPLILAAIRVLRTMHDKRGIVPLIEFLERQDLKRERTDAHLALVSLTGVDHGPYATQWKKWWEDSKDSFAMPKDPKPTGNVVKPDKGKTFYGIHTFSDKILYIVDISGSMDKQVRGEGADGRTKMEVLKQELIGSVFNLNPTDTFNVVLFNHQVIPWQQRKMTADDRSKKMLKEWVEKQKPLGGTNIYDSLELGFKIAHRTTGAPDLDTIFFLTDGKPTAGKIRDSKRILEVFRAWNETGNLTIHTIGIGKDHDAEFLKELAKIGDGTYIAR